MLCVLQCTLLLPLGAVMLHKFKLRLRRVGFSCRRGSQTQVLNVNVLSKRLLANDAWFILFFLVCVCASGMSCVCVCVHVISCRTRSGGASNSWRRSASERRRSERSRMRRGGGGGRRREPDGRRRRRSVCRESRAG